MEDADIVLRSDHLPLKKFLHKNTLNTKVNNWAVEISPYRIQFEYIKGIKNTLADTMSRLIQMDPEARLDPGPEGGMSLGTMLLKTWNPSNLTFKR